MRHIYSLARRKSEIEATSSSQTNAESQGHLSPSEGTGAGDEPANPRGLFPVGLLEGGFMPQLLAIDYF